MVDWPLGTLLRCLREILGTVRGHVSAFMYVLTDMDIGLGSTVQNFMVMSLHGALGYRVRVYKWSVVRVKGI